MKYKLQGIKFKQLQGRSLSNVTHTSNNPTNTINNNYNNDQKTDQSSTKNKIKR